MKVAIILFVIVGVAIADDCCGENEVMNSCASPCGDGCVHAILNTVCILSCSTEPRCTCKPGFFRDPVTGECVDECDCPAWDEYNYCTKENEVATYSTTCLERCDAPMLNCPLILPAPDQKPECFCKTGYCKNPGSDKCVPRRA